MVVIRHYAPSAEGLVYLQKAVLSALAVSNKHSKMDSVNSQLCLQRNNTILKTQRDTLESSFSILQTHFHIIFYFSFFLIHHIFTSFEDQPFMLQANRKPVSLNASHEERC